MTELHRLDRAAIEPLLPGIRADEMGWDPDDGFWLGVTGDGGAPPLAVVHMVERGEAWMLDEVWVVPEQRGRGLGSDVVAFAASFMRAAGAAEIWLICDDDMVEWYRARGWLGPDADGFPEPLARLCASRGEWPEAADHAHHAMRLPLG